MTIKRFCLISGLILLLPLFGCSQNILELSSSKKVYSLGEHIYVFEDTAASLEFKEAESSEFWKNFLPSTQDKPNFGYTASAIWFSFTLKANDSTSWLLHLDTPLLEDVTLWQQAVDGTWNERKFGNLYPFPSWDFDHTSPTVRLPLIPNQETRFFMRFKNESPMVLPIYIREENAFHSYSRNHHYAYGIYFGGLAIMLLFNLVLFSSMREINYVYYIASVLIIMLLVATVSGFNFKYLTPDYVGIQGNIARTLAGLIVIVTALFAQSFLNTKHYSPIMHKVLYVNMGLAVIGTILTASMIWPGATTRLVSIHSPILLLTGIIVWRNGNKYARFYTIAWGTYIIGGLSYTLRITGTLPVNFWTTHGAEIGSAMEIILIAIALSDRFRVIREEREEAIEKQLAIKQEAAATLENKVQERTRELHDSNQELNQLNEELNAAYDTLNLQKDDLERKNQNIQASITYAKRIQDAILPRRAKIREVFPNNFIFFRPRDVVSGDFYFFTYKDDEVYFAAADCTGHGVPGAFMSMIGNDLLHQIIDTGYSEPGEILLEMHLGVRKALRQSENTNSDGMTIALCRYIPKKNILQFAGGKQGLFMVEENGESKYIRGDGHEVAGLKRKKRRDFQTHQVKIDTPTSIYMYSDGFPDQFGGEAERKYGQRHLRDTLKKLSSKPMIEQSLALEVELREWKKDTPQIDDILVWGIRLEP
ncbi:MAG: 7TM diverse intracellular signaling domain-containing protein [Bacteroidota bacterium]